MQSPIAITVHPTLGPVVSARALYPLISKSKASRNIFSDWFREKEKRFDLKQGIDFTVGSILLPETGSNRQQIEFILTLETAKLLCRKAPANRGLTVLAFLDVYGVGTPAQAAALPVSPLLMAGAVSIDAPELLKEHTPLEKMERYVSGLPPVTGPIETRAQRLRRELAEAEAAEQEEALRAANPQPVDYSGRIDELEHDLKTYTGKIDALLLFFQQSATILKGFTPATIEQPSARTLTVRLVDRYVNREGVEHQHVWQYLYKQLASRSGFDAFAQGNGKKDPNYLDIVEQAGQIDNLYIIARSVLTKQPEPAVASE